MKTRKRISMFIFLLGLSLILYPMISRSYYDIYYRMEAQRFTEEVRNNAGQIDLSFYKEQLAYNSSGISDLSQIEVADVGFVNDNEEIGKDPKLLEEDVLGILSVPKIDLTYAIRDGASDYNLSNGLARLEGTSYPVGGINTNSVISGHNGLAGKVFFSRLTELEAGDLVIIDNHKETLYYEVFDNTIIEPTDSAALAIVPGQDMVTLLTCTSPPPGTHRYLVFAKRVEAQADSEMRETFLEEEQQEVTRLPKFIEQNELFIKRYGSVFLVLGLGLLVMYFEFREPRR